MPIPTTFLDTCRARVLLTAEYAAFVDAGALADTANLDFLLIPSTLITGLS